MKYRIVTHALVERVYENVEADDEKAAEAKSVDMSPEIETELWEETQSVLPSEASLG